MTLLVGSWAFANRTRTPKDIDLIVRYEDIPLVKQAMHKATGEEVLAFPLSPNKTKLVGKGRVQHVECEIAWPGSTGEALLNRKVHRDFEISAPGMKGSMSSFFREIVRTLDANTAALDELYTLKMSHRYLKNSPHFSKTRQGIMFMRSLGAKIFDEDWLKQREKETYKYDHPNLNTSKDDFFKVEGGSNVKYIFDHDSIHEFVAAFVVTARQPHNEPLTPAAPAYTLYKGEGDVLSDKKKFFELPHAIRIRGVLEEAYVLALERSQIPYGGVVPSRSSYANDLRHAWGLRGTNPRYLDPSYQYEDSLGPPTPQKSFVTALEKVCSSITSGWFREFAWENFDEVYDAFNATYALSFWWHAYNKQFVRENPRPSP